ncbi:hypothetical protein [Streptomyces sp. NBC_00461]|uniref:hypothetical protein n=1 Tax=Streptomyces sp. NBC_00461 TaxID=2975750 RepID=UPI003FCD3111
MSPSEIARETGLDRKTVRKYLAGPATPPRRSPSGQVVPRNSARARAFGKMQDVQGKLTAVGAADDAFARSNPAEDPAWMHYYDDAQHHGDTAHALFDLSIHADQDPRRAAQGFATAVAGTATTMRARAAFPVQSWRRWSWPKVTQCRRPPSGTRHSTTLADSPRKGRPTTFGNSADSPGSTALWKRPCTCVSGSPLPCRHDDLGRP